MLTVDDNEKARTYLIRLILMFVYLYCNENDMIKGLLHALQRKGFENFV